MVDLIRNYDGEISRPLNWYLAQGVPIEEFDQFLEELKQSFLQNLIIFNHDMTIGNLLFQKTSTGSARLVVIDGLGDVSAIDWLDHFPFLVRRKINRRWKRFMDASIRSPEVRLQRGEQARRSQGVTGHSAHASITQRRYRPAMNALVFAAALAGVIIFGGSAIATKVAVSAISAIDVSIMRTIIGGAGGAAAGIRTAHPAARLDPQKYLLLVSGFCGFIAFPLLFTLGVNLTTANHATMILAILPVLTGAIAQFWDRHSREALLVAGMRHRLRR